VRRTLASEQEQAAEARRQLAAAQAEIEAARARVVELERARDAARHALARAERAHADALAAWDERRRALEEGLAAVTEARAAERMDWMTARLSLETRLSQADDELERQREDADALRAELARVAARHDRLARSELFGYAVTTLDGWLVHCNDACARLLGYQHAREALASASAHAFGADGSDVISASGLVEGEVRYRDGQLTRVDGESVRVLQSALLVAGPGQDPLVERILVDLSDRTSLEERLRDAQRLEALGRLAAAMAPGLETLAALVEAGLSTSVDPLEDGSDATLPSAVAELRQLVAFARKQARPPAFLDLNDALERLSPVLARLVSSHVEFVLRLGSTALVAADEEDFEQLVTGLVVAARDRLTAGGSLIVESGAIETTDTDSRPAISARAGTGAVLTVVAVGYGIDLADRPSALEALAGRLGGILHVSGTPGRRIAFRVDLPRHR
jgi:PAS domain-containing protein